MKTQCNYNKDVLAYLQNELSPDEARQFKEHLDACSDCQRVLADYQRLLVRLRRVSPESIRGRGNLAERVLEEVNRRSIRQPRYLLRTIAAAAAVLVILGIGWWVIYHHSPATTLYPTGTDETISKALDWLARNQDESGAWPVEKWGGQKQYEVALTGLSVMALAGSESDDTRKYLTNIRKGIKFIINQQSVDGQFGPRFSGTLYNHGIATACLLEVYALFKDKELKPPIREALRYLESTQTPNGGWGYLLASEPPNSAVSFWALQSLLLAKGLGFAGSERNESKGLDRSLERGFQWLVNISDESGRLGYRTIGEFPYGEETLSAMAVFCYTYGGARYLAEKEKYQNLLKGLSQKAALNNQTDYYRFYFMAYLEHPDLAEWHKRLAINLVKSQSRETALAGSWEVCDQWGKVGGRVYTTALAVLTLEISTRAPRLKNWLSQTD